MLKIPKLTIFGIAVAIAIVVSTTIIVFIDQQQSAFAHSTGKLTNHIPSNPTFQAHSSGHIHSFIQELNPTDG
jgi:hypothetical protein